MDHFYVPVLLFSHLLLMDVQRTRNGLLDHTAQISHPPNKLPFLFQAHLDLPP